MGHKTRQSSREYGLCHGQQQSHDQDVIQLQDPEVIEEDNFFRLEVSQEFTLEVDEDKKLN